MQLIIAHTFKLKTTNTKTKVTKLNRRPPRTLLRLDILTPQLQLVVVERVPALELILLALPCEFMQGLRKLAVAPLLLTWAAPRVVTWAFHPWAGVEGLWEKALVASLFPQ